MSFQSENDDYNTNSTGEFIEDNFEGRALAGIISNCKTKFNDDLHRLSDFVDGNEVSAIDHFARVIYEVSLHNPKNLIVSLTDSHSIHFKIFNDIDFETHLEVFYLTEDEEEEDINIESVLTIFKNEQEFVKGFGTLDQVLSKYRKAIGKGSVSFIESEPDVLSY